MRSSRSRATCPRASSATNDVLCWMTRVSSIVRALQHEHGDKNREPDDDGSRAPKHLLLVFAAQESVDEQCTCQRDE
jgi:hypothetical protein